MRTLARMFHVLSFVLLTGSFFLGLKQDYKYAYRELLAYVVCSYIARVFKRSAELDEVQLGKRQSKWSAPTIEAAAEEEAR